MGSRGFEIVNIEYFFEKFIVDQKEKGKDINKYEDGG